MKRLLLLATAASAVALSVAAPAAAQSWQAINQRQASIDQRIDQGIRSGSLTQQEGIQLRAEFRAIANLGGADIAALIWDKIEAKRR